MYDHSTYKSRELHSQYIQPRAPYLVRSVKVVRSLEVSRGYGLLITLYYVITYGECTADNAKAQAF